MHPMRLTQPVRQQMKHLALCWRSTFYVADCLRQRPMLSVKELNTSIVVNLIPVQRLYAAMPHWELARRRANVALTPCLKPWGCGNGLLKRIKVRSAPMGA
jgi:hypothetical protein